MDETIYVIFMVQSDFVLEKWFSICKTCGPSGGPFLAPRVLFEQTW